VRSALATTALLALLALAALMLLPPLFGYERYVIEGGSMGGALPRGSIAFEEVVPTSELRPGDVITYRPPRASRPVTHRIVAAEGNGAFHTRGDANPAPDPWAFTLPDRRQARLAFHVPLAGYAIAALEIRAVRIAVIGIPALAIAMAALATLAPPRRRELTFG
jgi:signal peptidase